MDVPLQATLCCLQVLNIFVSILVLMDVPLQDKRSLSDDPEIYVSILVLMDVPLQALIEAYDGGKVKSFNPCFNGCTSSRALC